MFYNVHSSEPQSSDSLLKVSGEREEGEGERETEKERQRERERQGEREGEGGVCVWIF